MSSMSKGVFADFEGNIKSKNIHSEIFSVISQPGGRWAGYPWWLSGCTHHPCYNLRQKWWVISIIKTIHYMSLYIII